MAVRTVLLVEYEVAEHRNQDDQRVGTEEAHVLDAVMNTPYPSAIWRHQLFRARARGVTRRRKRSSSHGIFVSFQRPMPGGTGRVAAMMAAIAVLIGNPHMAVCQRSLTHRKTVTLNMMAAFHSTPEQLAHFLEFRRAGAACPAPSACRVQGLRKVGASAAIVHASTIGNPRTASRDLPLAELSE